MQINDANSDTALIVGCGYIGCRLAARLRETGASVTGVVRSSDSASALAEQGVAAIRCDLDREPLPRGSTAGKPVYYLAPPPRGGVVDTRMERFLDGLARSGQPQRILYISTTGVYGDCKGAWVDESRAPDPQTDRARRRWHAEQVLQDWRRRSGGGLVILRVPGIYGPGKLPLARLHRRVPMVAERDAPWTNRIHADDLVSACLAAMERGLDGEAYNACDGTPGTMTDYFNRVADMAGIERPPLISLQQARQELSPELLSYLGESRRLSNAKLARDTGWRPRYPSLASGLSSCFS